MGNLQPAITMYEHDRKALEALVVGNPELEQLEAQLDQFNLFEAIGAVRQELRHSDFLCFLLDPRQPHGLGDTFVKRLLQQILAAATGATALITSVDLDLWDLDGVVVEREWQNIDLFLRDETHRFFVIIENKIDSGEIPGQLGRYREVACAHYPGYQMIGLFLTPDGALPSDESYLPVSYGAVCAVLEGRAKSRASTLGADVLTTIVHYTQMLRRHIVGDSDIAELCRRIYQRHRRALDLIYEHRPD